MEKENEECKATIAKMQSTLENRSEITALNVSLLLRCDKERASILPTKINSIGNMKRLVRWMADCVCKIAMIGQYPLIYNPNPNHKP